ncbi:hypothetical protein ACFYUV_50030 [Nonomuraea sp. NPDC003560]|uniref:hypothetical protein n=1 Tax=Nonomuraea sp. NPDC003560 TaxID=3364341 RepID=UPI0036B66693
MRLYLVKEIPGMRLPALAAAALTTAALLASSSPHASAAQAAGVLNLWSGLNQTGQVQPVPVPELEGCAAVDSSFLTRSVGNRSQSLAALYTNPDCEGEPAEIVSPGRRTNLARPRDIESIAFQ